MSVYFASDLHLGHLLASDMRGFNDIRDHDEAVIESLLKVDHKRAMIWILGDVAMSRSSLSLLGELKSNLKMVRGNHDQFNIEEYQEYFSEIHGFLKYKNLWLSHCPIHPQEMYRCNANVHGHIHKNTNSPELPYPYINVNWDFHRGVVSLDDIKKIVLENKLENQEEK